MNHPPIAHQLTEQAQRLHLELSQAITRHRPPCLGRPEWTSDDPADRAAALEGCTHCPHQAPCGAYARAAREAHGVWAGTDRTWPPSTARRRAQTDEETSA